jgi:hypothetical protein
MIKLILKEVMMISEQDLSSILPNSLHQFNTTLHLLFLKQILVIAFYIEKVDYLSEYHMPWIKAWKESSSYQIWQSSYDTDYVGMINAGHPCHGHSVFGAMAASFSAFGKNIGPIQQNVSKSLATASSTVTEVVSTLADPTQQEATASILY